MRRLEPLNETVELELGQLRFLRLLKLVVHLCKRTVGCLACEGFG
jgi:hypothetical protein